MSIFRALGRVAAPLRRCTAQCLVEQPTLSAQCGRSFTATVESLRAAPVWTLSRMASTAREVGRESDGALLKVLRSELEHQRKTYSQPKDLSRGPPKPWTLTDKKSHAEVILRRSYGGEDIAITCVYQPDANGAGNIQDEEEEEGSDQDYQDDESAACINMSVTVDKGEGNPTLEISAVSYGSEVSIDHVYCWEDKESKEALYEGPNFLQLDEDLQSQFEKYIKDRGVNKELVSYLFKLLEDKEERQYTRWLETVERFVKM